MKVLLIGCGAVGLSVASALYGSEIETHLVARGATALAIKEGGIKRCGLFGEAFVPPEKIKVFDKIEAAESGYDYILNSAKATGNEDIAKSLAGRKADILSSKGLLILFQNGFGNEQAFTDIWDEKRIYHGSFAIGFQRLKPNISEVTVVTKPVSIGSLFGQPAEAVKELAEAIDRGGIPCQITEEIGKTLWAKLLYNCALNPLSAILRTNYGGLVKSKSSIDLMGKIIDELFAVMKAAGYETFWENAGAYKKEFFEKILPPTYGHNASTLQDMERKIPTEIDSLNGAVVRLGRKYNVPTPCNSVITQLIKSAESLY